MNRQIAISFVSILSCLLILCSVWNETMEDFPISFLVFFAYFILVCVLKITVSFIVLGKRDVSTKEFRDFVFLNVQLFIFTPDYVIAKFCKDVFWQTKKDSEKRASLIRLFNIENLVISFLFVLLFCFFAYTNLLECYFLRRFVLVLLGARIISRTIEISISFVKDVCSSKHSSSLDRRGRITLAFLSILEVLILSFGVSYCAPTEHNVSKAAIEAISLIQQLPNSLTGGTNIVKTFSAISCFSLIGVVIGSYLGERKTNAVKAIEDAPQLFVMDETGLRNAIVLSEAEKDGHWELTLINKVGCSYVFNYRGKYCHLSNDDYKRMPFAKPAKLADNFF